MNSPTGSAPARVRPELSTTRQIGRLGEDARADYDDARHDWHANFGTLIHQLIDA